MTEKETLQDLIVIGAGLPRTGTLSTRAALEHLLGGPCYHGAVPIVERQDHIEKWTEVLTKGKLDYEVAKQLLAGYKAGVDHPFFCWYKELLEMKPTAKVLLTVRDPRGWYASAGFMNTVLSTLSSTMPYSWFLSLVGQSRQIAYIRSNLELPLGLNGRMHTALREGEEEAITFFNNYVEEVKAAVPPDQLLVFNVKEGWEPLCKFLDHPIPSIPFPKINDKREILLVFNIVRIVSWATILGLPVLITLILPHCEGLMHLLILSILGLAVLWGSGHLCRRVVRKQAEKSKMQ